MLTHKQKRQLNKLQQAFQQNPKTSLNRAPTYDRVKQAYLKAQAKPQVVVLKGRQMGASTMAALNQAVVHQLYPQLINDAFFTQSPFMSYLKKNQIVDDDFNNNYVAPHVPGQLCELNPFCEECYS